MKLSTKKNKLILGWLEKCIVDGVSPAAELIVAHQGKKIFYGHVGYPESNKLFFDLASLTKSLSTSLLCMLAYQEKKLNPDQYVTDFFESKVLKKITIRQLLNHTSGFKDWYNFSIRCHGKEDILRTILNKQSLRTHLVGQTHYSDIGYILLGFILEKIYNKTLDKLFEQKIAKPLGLNKHIFYVPLFKRRLFKENRFLPSEQSPYRKKLIVGEAMDENAYALGGVAGHAGLFSHAQIIHRLLKNLRQASFGKSRWLSQEAFWLFARPDTHRKLKQRKFTLGFDTPTQPKSQSGRFFTKNSIGHLGYSGTSFWWDLDRDIWIILLTNRCQPTRQNKKISLYRPWLHNKIFELLNI